MTPADKLAGRPGNAVPGGLHARGAATEAA